MKNIDRMRNMNSKELAELLALFSICDHCVYVKEDCIKMIKSQEVKCEEGIEIWLNSEMKIQQ